MFGRALSWSVPAETDVPDLAVEFLRRFTSKETATKRAEELGAVTPVLDAPAPPGIDGIEQVLEDAQSARFILYNYGVGSAQFGLREAWYNPLVEMWLGELTPQEALDKIDANMAAVREQRREAAQ
jgi:ABC-type glycerol-3-phosphate transport system substrate-binding protein